MHKKGAVFHLGRVSSYLFEIKPIIYVEKVGSKGENPSYFAAIIFVATIWDQGEVVPQPRDLDARGTSTICTTGPLILLTGKNVVALDTGPELAEEIVAE